MKEFLLLILGAVIGLVLEKIYNKIFEEKLFEKRVRKIFLEASRDATKRRLTVQELNRLLRKRVLGRNGQYIACPRCGSKNLNEGFTTFGDDDSVDYLECKNCGWSGGNSLFKPNEPQPL